MSEERKAKRKATREEKKQDKKDLADLLMNLKVMYGQEGALERAVECLLSLHPLVGKELGQAIMDYMVGPQNEEAETKPNQ